MRVPVLLPAQHCEATEAQVLQPTAHPQPSLLPKTLTAPAWCPCRYKTMFTRLKALKVEIEHLQLLMDRAKVKLQKEFEAWWAAEASSLQVCVAAGPC